MRQIPDSSFNNTGDFMTSTVNAGAKTVKPIPEGYNVITPYLIVDNASAAIEFYVKAFGAKERFRMPGKDGKIMHAEMQFGDSVVMLADECPQMNAKSAKTFGGSPIRILQYVTDVDAVVKQAVAAGAKLEVPVETKFYGDRSGSVVDPFGYSWHIATHVEDVSPEEMDKRAKAQHGGSCGA
jgi:PhnB protein